MVAPGRTANSLAHGAARISKRIVLSYVVDWILIIATAAVGGAFSVIHGNRHAFSLDDPSISFPYKTHETVSTGVLLVVSLVAPGVLIAFISLVFVPGKAAARGASRALIWRRKLWEWNTGWMGLGVALAGAFMVTEGLKDLYGKPRPDLLARCDPDLSNINAYAVGGLGLKLDEAAVMVTDAICRQPDAALLRDGFASFPSGHSSFSWAGMLYLTLFMCAKFAIQIPFLAPSVHSGLQAPTFHQAERDLAADIDRLDPSIAYSTSATRPTTTRNSQKTIPDRNQAAAPPIYLLILAFIPLCVAFFISASRWADYRHHGFDIISGSLIGIFFAWFGFRWYHLPIRRGAGWSWGARSRDRAFYVGVGMTNYVGDEGWRTAEGRRRGPAAAAAAAAPADLESGSINNGNAGNDVLGGGRKDENEATTVGNGDDRTD